MESERTPGLDAAVTELQRLIAEMERTMYSSRVIEQARHPRNVGMILDPDGHAAVTGPCGDTMEIFLRVDGDRIAKAAFMTDGCGPTLACGSAMTTMVQGMTLEEAAAVDGGDLILALDGLPPEHVHCASLAVEALRQAIAQCRGEVG